MTQQGFQEARKMTRRHAHTFYLTSLFLPKEKRLAAYAVYAVCRLSDESVDDTGLALEQKQRELAGIREKIDRAFGTNMPGDPLLQAFRQSVQTYKIPKEYFDELLEGMSMDLTRNRYQDFDDLYLYAYKVAGVIGLIMLKIFGYKEPAAEPCAVDLGIALQLTNILRDIDEDLARGRIYLPLNELRQYQIDEAGIAQKKVDENFRDFMDFQIKRAKGYFLKASRGIELIKDPRCQFVTFLILELYAKILTKIEKNNFDIYTKRAFVPLVEKLCTILLLACRFARRSFLFKM